MFSPILAYVALQAWLNVVNEPVMRFMCIYVVRHIAAQIADDSLILVVIEFNVQRQIVEFYHFVAMRTIDTRVILFGVLIELFLCGVAFDAFGFDAFEWH